MARDNIVTLKLSDLEMEALSLEAVDRQNPRTEVLRDFVKELVVKWKTAGKL